MFSFGRYAFSGDRDFDFEDLEMDNTKKKNMLFKKQKIFNPYFIKMLKLKLSRMD